MPKIPAIYVGVQAMEPMLPEASRGELAELTCDVLRKSGQLAGQISAEINRRRIAGLVQEMNSYYSNLIEGHRTLPRDIERAMRKEYSTSSKEAANQHLASAHIEVERLMLERLKGTPGLSIHSPEFLCWLHGEFYGRLPEALHYSERKTGKPYRIEPGELRKFEVDVSAHQPPAHAALGKFLQRFQAVYSDPQILPTDQLVALAAAHHRLAWIHPFGDGNGRVCRLYSHAWLVQCQADGLGLWTLSRGLARRREEYYRFLAGADRRRTDDIDGRGNLSGRGLTEFCVFFLQVMLDQIEFMADLLQLPTLAIRMERFVQFELAHLKQPLAGRLIRLLKAALIQGEIERGQVGEIVGLGSTASRQIIQTALHEKLLASATPKGPLSLVFSSRTLDFYFPKLYLANLPITEEA